MERMFFVRWLHCVDKSQNNISTIPSYMKKINCGEFELNIYIKIRVVSTQMFL